MAREGSGRGCIKRNSQNPASWADRAAIHRGRDRRRRSPEGKASWALHIPRGGAQEAIRNLSLTLWKEIRVRGRDLGIINTSGKALGEDDFAPQRKQEVTTGDAQCLTVA